MKVFFATPFRSKSQLQPYYDLIEDTLKKLTPQVIVANFEDGKKLLKQIDMHSLKDDESLHYEIVEKGMLWADLIVAEVTSSELLLGYQIQKALVLKKKILGISLNENLTHKINDPNFIGKIYTKENLKEILNEFLIQNNTYELNIRFNMFLSKTLLTYITIKSKELNISKSDFIRSLIESDMAQTDTNNKDLK
jgi:hypothetical protein